VCSFVDIFPVSAVEALQSGDRIFLAASIESMLTLQAAVLQAPQKGLTLLDVDALDLPGACVCLGAHIHSCLHSLTQALLRHTDGITAHLHIYHDRVCCMHPHGMSHCLAAGRGTEFLELVLGSNNHFIGKTLSSLRAGFATKYGASVIAVRKHGSSHESDKVDTADYADALRGSEPMCTGDIVLVLAKEDFAALYDPR
jgi:hypothetical protein